MSTQDAGRIPQDWLDACRVNESPDNTVEDWFRGVLNADVEIDAVGCVWVLGGWMTQQKIDDAIKRIDAGI